MTEEEYMKKHEEYSEKEKYYHKKVLDLELKYFKQINNQKKVKGLKEKNKSC